MNYIWHILIVCEIYLILTLSMNLLAGHSGLLSLSQAAFYGIGAYVSALMLTKLGASFSVAFVGAVLFNVFISFPVVWFSIRLRDLYFTLATLAWQTIVFAILYNWVSVTNGPFGIRGIPKPELLGLRISSMVEYAVFGGVIVIFALIFFTGLNRSPLARYIEGVRDDQLALMSLGFNPNYYKSITIVISSAVSAMAGVMFASYESFIDPTSFTLSESMLIVSMVLIGGLGTIKGSVAGALFYVLLPELLTFLDIPSSVSANLRMMIYSTVLICILMFKPYGMFGKFKFE